ncbi:helix-turn-helix domain-containing protein [Microbacterium resistens]|uniref:helix-turn-helix domain-containing protein n=1 Tax=Microbacterium resistens TaxID=156977 RepID=UPI00082FD32A|nr:helix-turn-helix transcriptional regulator [Microbacterium resistens]
MGTGLAGSPRAVRAAVTDATGVPCPADVERILVVLNARGVHAVPRVVARLRAQLQDDDRALVEVAGRLTHAEATGRRPLPHPLPLTPALAEPFARETWSPEERSALLLAALSADDRLSVLLRAGGCRADRVLGSRLSRDLCISAGRFAFADERLRAWVLGSADHAERLAAHDRLAAAYAAVGERGRAQWHRACARATGDPRLVPDLLTLAADALADGDAEWAFLVAREAAGHAAPADVASCRLLAGRAALAAGWAEEASRWLSPLLDDPAIALDALPEHLAATAFLHGAVPEIELAEYRPAEDGAERWRTWSRAAAVGAALSAERGERARSRRLLALTRDPTALAIVGGTIRDAAAAWCALYERERDEEAPSADTLRAALYRALAGDPEGGLFLLAPGNPWPRADALWDGLERGPVAEAYRIVAVALLRFWRGEVRTAAELLRASCGVLPVEIPFAGLGVTLLRRLELAVDGRTGPLSQALAAGLAPGTGPDGLVERGVAAYLAGRSDEAATHLRLWSERGASSPCLAVPGLDEVGPLTVDAAVEPPDAAHARHLRAVVRTLVDGGSAVDYAGAADAGRRVRSPFERGRIEALLGAANAARGERSAGLRHLRAARTLFAEAGADAWAASVTTRLARLGAEEPAPRRLPEGSGIDLAPVDPLGTCRTVWEPLLTERELEVAMRVAEGSTNREIAASLGLSVRTVEVHVGRLFAKFGVRSRSELTALAHRTNQHG